MRCIQLCYELVSSVLYCAAVFIRRWVLVQEACTQFDEKPVVHLVGLSNEGRSVTYCLYWLQSSAGYARNSRKNNYGLWWHSMDSKPYVKLAKGCLTLPSQRGLYTILGKTSYTLVRLTKHTFVILYTILGKPAIHLAC